MTKEQSRLVTSVQPRQLPEPYLVFIRVLLTPVGEARGVSP